MNFHSRCCGEGPVVRFLVSLLAESSEIDTRSSRITARRYGISADDMGDGFGDTFRIQRHFTHGERPTCLDELANGNDAFVCRVLSANPPPARACLTCSASVPRDTSVLTEEDEHRYVAVLGRNGFFGPDSWHMSGDANGTYAEHARANWRLAMPVLFLHGEYDYVCEMVESRLANPMRAHCSNLTETIVKSEHWMAQRKPLAVNAALSKWLATQ
ncbi:MAG: alpha/beta fold hydrolase, partial [Porticoccaceae bacterium]